MEDNIVDKLKSVEMFMMAQFIDVLNVLEQYESYEEIRSDIKSRKKIYSETICEMGSSKDFFSLSLYNKNIDAKLEECSDIYSSSKEYQDTLKELETTYNSLEKNLNNKDKETLNEIKDLIYSLSDFDVHLAYKIGLVDGLKIKKSDSII